MLTTTQLCLQDLLSSSKVNVTGLFPDDFVESPSLFKRKGWYYLTYAGQPP